MSQSFCALIVSPLSRDFQTRFEAAVGLSPEYIVLSELRQLSPLAMFARIWRLSPDQMFIPIEDANSIAVLPILRGIAGLTRARRISIVHPDLKIEPVRRGQVLRFALSILRASLKSAADARQCGRELDELLLSPSIALEYANDDPRKAAKIFYLNANLWFGVKAGGSVGHIAGVLNAFANKGYSITYAAASPPFQPQPSVTYHELRCPSVSGFPFELNYYRFHRAVVSQLTTLMRSARPVFIYQRMSLANYAGVVLSRLVNVPLVLEYNGSEVWIARNWGRPLRFEKLAAAVEAANLKHSHIIITVSEVLGEDLVERGVNPERIVVYPNCVDATVFDPARFSAVDTAAQRQQYGIAEDALVATFIGTFGEWHGVDVLAAAIRKMIDDDPDWLRRHRMHFLLVGDGLKMAKVREILSGDAVGEFCTLAGLVQQDQAPIHLALSDILLSPHAGNKDGSRFFGSPTKLFEYMAMGKAIVASDLDQIGQVLQPSLRAGEMPATADAGMQQVAILCEPGNIQQLILGIRQAATDPTLRRLLGENARHRALDKYTWEHHVQACLDRLHDVVSPSAREQS